MAFQAEMCDSLPSMEIDSPVAAASRGEGVEPELIRGVVRLESRFRPCAVSPKGALDLTPLMQLAPQTAADLEVLGPFDPLDHVPAVTKLLRQLLQHYDGDLAFKLGAWNTEPRRVDAAMALPVAPQTADSVQRILSFLTIVPEDGTGSFDFDQP